MKRILFLFFLFSYTYFLWGQDASKGWSVVLDGETFFRNNEYSAPYGTGYTLPGYKLMAKAAYEKSFPIGTARIEAGGYAMGYWGAEVYPKGTWFAELPHWTEQSERQKVGRVIPLFGLSLAPNKHFLLRMGALDKGQNHDLIAPLYNPELRYTADPEQGVQLKIEYPFLRGEAWIDWQSFIFRADRHQEAFTAGLTASMPILLHSSYCMEANLQATATHRGGEINWLRSDTVHTYAALSLGVKQAITPFPTFREKTFVLETYFLLSSMRTAEPNNPLGKGFYASVGYQSPRFSTHLDYWRGHNFVAPMGGPFVNSRALWEGPYTKDAEHTSFLALRGKYAFVNNRSLSLGLQAQAWYHLQPLPQSSSLSHALELYLSFSPQWNW